MASLLPFPVDSEPRFVLITDAAPSTAPILPLQGPASPIPPLQGPVTSILPPQNPVSSNLPLDVPTTHPDPEPMYLDPPITATQQPEKKSTGPRKKPTLAKRGGRRSSKAGLRGGSGGRRSKKAGAGEEAGAALTGSGGDEGGGTDEESDEADIGPYCICRGPDDHRWMIQCESCDDWFHGECVNIDKELGESLVDRFVCPNCSQEHEMTRYKKICALSGCTHPCRLYSQTTTVAGKAAPADPTERSVFCSLEHCNAWWETLIRTLPRQGNAEATTAPSAALDELTQENMMALLSGRTAELDAQGQWRLMQRPFGGPDLPQEGNGDGEVEHGDVDAKSSRDVNETENDMIKLHSARQRPKLTHAEEGILAVSRADRQAIADHVVLCKKMLLLLEMATARRRIAVEAKLLGEDACGYDWRLDTVATKHAFAAFLASSEGEAVFAAGRMGDPGVDLDGAMGTEGPDGSGVSDDKKINGNQEAEESLVRGMCDRKRCKPHAGWLGMLSRTVRQQIKGFMADAKEKAVYEAFIRDAAAERHLRLQAEHNSARIFNPDHSMDGVT